MANLRQISDINKWIRLIETTITKIMKRKMCVLRSDVEGELGAEQAECGAVQGGGAVGGDCCAVGLCGVALVYVPAIHRIYRVQALHLGVAVRLGQD